jgi:hypothetical protein
MPVTAIKGKAKRMAFLMEKSPGASFKYFIILDIDIADIIPLSIGRAIEKTKAQY